MAKKIRNVKLHSEDIQKNSGKNISHTINKIKAHEREYTMILVLIFMVVISLSVYFALRVDTYNAYANNTDIGTGFSYSSRLVFLNNTMIGETKESSYNVIVSNMTNYNNNYVIRLVPDKEKIEDCHCNIATYDKIRYSLGDNIERSFSNNDMVLTTGFISSLEKQELPIKIWFSNEINREEELYFYGNIILEKIGD